MPTWPSTTINTTNLDSGTDRPSEARADIKQMADVVNELVNYGTPASGPTWFMVGSQLTEGQFSSDTEQTIVTTVNGTTAYYGVSIVTGNLRFKFSTAGTYLCWTIGTANTAAGKDSGNGLRLRNQSTSTNVKSLGTYTGSTVLYPWSGPPFPVIVSSTTHEYAFVLDYAGTSFNEITYNQGITLMGFKVA